MFDRIMVCLVRKGSQEFVDGTDASSQLHAPCSQQSVTVGLVKIPTVTKNGFLTNNGISTKRTYGLELHGHSRKYRFKNEEKLRRDKNLVYSDVWKSMLCHFSDSLIWDCNFPIVTKAIINYLKKIFIIIEHLWVGIWFFSVSPYQKTNCYALKLKQAYCYGLFWSWLFI